MLAIRRSAVVLAKQHGRPAQIIATVVAAPKALSARYSTGPEAPDATANRPHIDYNIHFRADESTKAQPAASEPLDVKTQLAEAALKHVLTKGWTVQALGAGANDLGYPSVLHGLFPGGGVDLIDYFLKKSKLKMRREMEHLDLDSMRITAKIRTACIMRLKLTAPYISTWPDALGIMAQPQNAPMSLRNLGELVDEMWYLAGDRSADLNWYSKRTLLAGVYTSTELYMTQDRSPDFEETWKFLDRRLQDVAFFGRTTSEITNYLQFGIKSAFGVLSSMGHKTPFDRR